MGGLGGPERDWDVTLTASRGGECLLGTEGG